MRLYRQKGDCQACHGWAADGRKMDSQMPDGANLRTTKLDRDKLIMAIKCGVPGKAMPAFDRLAYSDGRCYGLKQADLQKMNASMPDPAATLQPREIELLADEKELAEHLMLVDLARNDIGRVCTYGSIRVPEKNVIERYSHVMHIVSQVEGAIAPGRNAYDLLRQMTVMQGVELVNHWLLSEAETTWKDFSKILKTQPTLTISTPTSTHSASSRCSRLI